MLEKNSGYRILKEFSCKFNIGTKIPVVYCITRDETQRLQTSVKFAADRHLNSNFDYRYDEKNCMHDSGQGNDFTRMISTLAFFEQLTSHS